MGKYICKECNAGLITNKKHNLCSTCYSRLYKAGKIGTRNKVTIKGIEKIVYTRPPFFQKRKPAYKKRKDSRKKAIDKYGYSIVEEFEKIKTNPFYTLQCVADKYGITRERIRQLYIAFCGHAYTIDLKKQSELRAKELACIHDPRYKVAEYKINTPTHRGAIIEKKVLSICEHLGYNIEIPCQKQIDLKINGYKIEIKSTQKPKKTNPKGSATYYHFNVLPTQINANFFIACIVPKNIFYVIPRSVFSWPNNGKTQSIFIPSKESNHHLAKNTFKPFLEAWHLLERE